MAACKTKYTKQTFGTDLDSQAKVCAKSEAQRKAEKGRENNAVFI